jgi:hypothetical protein
MIVFKDHSGFQDYPATSDQPHFLVDDATAERIRNGEPYRINATQDAVEFLSQAELDQERLAEIQDQAEPTLDAKAQEVRLCYVSPGKDATYQEKAAELSDWIGSGRPTSANGQYPYMEAEAAARNVTLDVVGAEIEAARDTWAGVDPQIEAENRAGKVGVKAATTAQAAQDILDQALAALEALKP